MDLSGAAPGRRAGLVVLVPAAEPVVGRWRAQLDPSARYGMPAHFTVLYPWFRVRDLEPSLLAELAGLVATSAAFDVVFNRVERFPETLWLAPTPSEPILELVEAVRRARPAYQPFGGRFATVVPHLTVGDGIEPAAYGHVVADVERSLPVRTSVRELRLMAQDRAGRWSVHAAYPLTDRP